MTGAHRRTDQDLVRSAAKSVWSLFLFVGFLAVVGIPAYLIATDSKFAWIAITALQGLVTLELARQLALKVLRNRTPSPAVLADWIGDLAVVIGFVVVVLADIGGIQGWMHGAFKPAVDSVLGLFVIGMPVYWWRGQRRLALALTARSVAGRWPWSAGG